MKLTETHIREITRAVSHRLGLLEFYGTAGLRKSGWERMMQRLVEAGYFVPYVHGGYEITEEGRRVAQAFAAEGV